MSAELQPFDRDDYEEALVEVGLEKLELLATVSDGISPPPDGTIGYSTLTHYPVSLGSALEFDTTYRVPVIPDINPAILCHGTPPDYLLAIFSGLAKAIVRHANQQYPAARIPFFAPTREQFDDHVHSMWLRKPSEPEDYSFQVFSLEWPGPTRLEMAVTPHGSSVDYVNQKSYSQPLYDI